MSLFARLGIHENTIPKHTFSLHTPAGKFTTDVHQHTRYQLLYAESGVLHFYTAEQRFILPTNHGAWIPAGLNHKVVSTSAQLYLRTLYLAPPTSHYQFPKSLTIFPISPLAREMIRYTQQWDYHQPMTVGEASFYEAICHLIMTWCADAILLVLPTTEHQQLLSITIYLLDNLDKQLTTTQVGHAFGMSSRTLMRLFREEMDTTFQLYLRTARVIRALELLSLPKLSITDISQQVGYLSMSSFSHTFKEFVGKSPREFRQQESTLGN